MDECDDYKYYLEWVLIIVTILEQALSYTPDKYPKSILQAIIFVIYKTVLMFKVKPIDQPVMELKEVSVI